MASLQLSPATENFFCFPLLASAAHVASCQGQASTGGCRAKTYLVCLTAVLFGLVLLCVMGWCGLVAGWWDLDGYN
ncbi:Uncharacterized protein HZ326_16818 [Fusarium oxysporum f. sp. albedinis]|nr:Uncharacterized protein HZ326_16818 [Fusarium oxysporum f. sp. albedinis]